MPALTREELSQIVQSAEANRWTDPLNAAMDRWEINTPQRKAAFLAQIAHESGGLTCLEENLRYTAKRLCVVWPKRFPSLKTATLYAGNPERLANCVYAGRMGNGDEASGDGWRYRGRGLIQLTGRSNYAKCGAAIGVDILQSPDDVSQPVTAAQSAAWYWDSRGLNELADHRPGDDDVQDFTKITVMINNGKRGLEERLKLWARARYALGA